ncbi:DUF4157 domain-containing protein [Nitratireductor sp. XY-223]|uniref:eCIS core domain-containing protein n=1 Tax=Nitratireductor sp. XY-223 TaxID=2561926 RepID=UPI0010AB33CB|nr:DUF4157 domain-containing protein [Nitratireductor sp. XY-223]
MKRASDTKRPAPRIRPGPSRHEEQAVAAARAIDAGRPIPRLDHAPAAANLARPGGGRPLDAAFRGAAERTFDADLSAVRLQTGADSAALRNGVPALTAGADIHVACEENLRGEAGRSLLYHEIAHVLQQTGERGPDGRLRATRRFGSGMPFALGGPLQGINKPSREDLVSKLIEVHRTGDGGAEDADLEAVVGRISGEFDPERAGGSALSAEVRAGEISGTGKPLHQLSQRARGLLFDVLKFGGFDIGASTLLTGDIDIPSVAGHPHFYDAMSANATVMDALTVRVFARGRRLRQFITVAYPRAVWNFLIDLPRGKQPIYGFEAYFNALLAEVSDWNVLGRNEAILYGAYLVNSFVADYDAMIDRVRLQTSHLSGNRVQRKVLMASQIGAWATAMADALELFGGQTFVIEAHRRTAILAERAREFWTSAHARGHETYLAALRQAEEGGSFPESPVVAMVRNRLQTAGLRLLATTRQGELPPARVDRANRRNFRRSVEQVIAQIDRFVFDHLPRADEEFAEAHVVAGALRLSMDRLFGALDFYSSFAAEAEGEALQDVRIASRIKMARELAVFARMLRSRALERRTGDVLSGRDIRSSSLVLLSAWEEDPSTPVGAMAREISTHTEAGDAHLPISFSIGEGDDRRNVYLPLTVSDLVGIYRLMYTRRLANALSRMLASTQPEEDDNQRTIIQRAYGQARGDDRPMRWKVNTFEYVAYEGDTRSFRQLVESHGRTDTELETQVATNGVVLFPDHPAGGVFAWLVPPLDPLIRVLRRVDLLNQLIERAGFVPASELSNGDWMRALSFAAEDEGNLASILETVPLTLGNLQNTENERLAALLPLAVSYERRRTVRKVKDLLAAYVGDNLKKYGAPNDAQYAIEDFRRLVTPDELTHEGQTFNHANVQLAILMLTLAEDIETAFNPQLISGFESLGRRSETRFDIITGFTPMLRLALRSSVPGRSGQLLKLMNASERADLDISAARRKLRGVLRQFEAAAREMSARLALISTGTSLKSNLFASEIPVSEEPFFHDGKPVQIVRIFRPFVFLPAYGRGDQEVLPPTLLDAEREPIERSSDIVLVRIRIANGPPIDITAGMTDKDIALLMFLNDAIANRAFHLSMEGIGEAIEEAALLALDAAEFIPGAGQAIMVGRIIFEVGQFLLSDEFDDMLAVVRGQPVEELMAIAENLATDFFDTDVIWQFLLFNGTAIQYLDEVRSDPRRERVRRRGRGSKFSRIVMSIGQIPRHLYKRLNAVRARTVPRVRNIQTFVASHPNVAGGLEIAAAFARGVPVFGLDPHEVRGLLQAAEDPEASLKAKLTGMLDAIDKFELPDDPIPNDLIIAAMIEFILERLKRMGRIGKAIRVVLPILRVTGAIDEIGQQLANAMAGSAIDPNLVWQREIKEKVGKAFKEAKQEFVDTANGRLARFGLETMPDVGDVSFDETPLPEMTPDASPLLGDGLYAEPLAHLDTIGPGRPLSRRTLMRATREFGHDLSHARLHTGNDAAGLTARYGALGLTSGSHIFLRPGLSPDAGEGRNVMRHELAHVIQNTGPSPFGEHGYRQRHPVLGQPGKGLRIDGRREAEADRAASAAAAPGHRIGNPVDAGSGGGPGLAPALGGRLFADILTRFTEPADIENFVAGVQREAETRATAPGVVHARSIWRQVKAALSNSRKSRFRGHTRTDGVPDLIRDQINTGRGAQISNQMIAVLASRSQRPAYRRGQRVPPGAPHTELNPAAFANALEAFVFGFTGIAMSIRLERGSERPDVSRVTVYLVDLGRLEDDSHPLWQKALSGTPQLGTVTPQDKELLLRIARLRRPNEKILASRHFSLDDQFVLRFRSLKSDAAGVSVAPWVQYTTVDAENPGTGTDHRLRLGTHGQLTGIGTPNRESHHIPQFVLIEYFRNDAATPMFEDASDRLPGFEANENPGRFSDGSNSINLETLHSGSGRGNGMPAILLAARTHKMGRLHIGGKSAWDSQNDTKKAPSTQSDQVATLFRRSAMRHLRGIGAPTGGDNLTTDFSRVAVWANRPSNRRRAKPQVFAAMQDTYHWMYRDVMRPALSRALRTEEPKFYIAAALQARGGSATTLDQRHDPSRDLDRSNAVMREVDNMQTSGRYEIRNFRPSV